MTTCPNCQHENPPDSTFCTECGKPLKKRDSLGTVDTPMPADMGARGASQAANLDLEPGTVFADRYEIVERIGQGGMGVVYRAKETLGSRTREIALKLIRADRLADAAAIDRLVGEGVLTQDIRHPNVVSVYNVGVAEEKPFVAMEFVDGVSLRDWIRSQMNAQKEAPLETVSALLHNALDGLEAAHRIGVIHRDLKPENIILTAEPDGVTAPLKILDFGIARTPGTVDAVTGTGLGTPNYMAPEQITNPSAASASADLYSLSVIFYELLMGVLPKGHWQPPSGGRGDVPESIDKLIQEGLSNRPLSRPQDVAEYRARLDAALKEVEPAPTPEPTPAPTPTPVPPPPPPPPPPPDPGGASRQSNKKWLVGVLAAGGLAVVIGLMRGDPEPRYPEDDPPYYPDPGPTYPEDLPDEPLDFVEPELEPSGEIVTFADYNGDWNYPAGSFRMAVDNNGNVSGPGNLPDGTQVTLNGSLLNGQFTVTDGYQTWPGIFVFTNLAAPECHLNFQFLDANYVPWYQEQFHVGHGVGEQYCPDRFFSPG